MSGFGWPADPWEAATGQGRDDGGVGGCVKRDSFARGHIPTLGAGWLPVNCLQRLYSFPLGRKEDFAGICPS